MMPDYRFTYTKTFDMVFEASTEHEAWVQAMSLAPDTVPNDWEIKLNENVASKPQDLPPNAGPVEIDDWEFDPKDVPE